MDPGERWEMRSSVDIAESVDGGLCGVCEKEPVEVMPKVPELRGDRSEVPFKLCASSVMRCRTFK